MGILFMSSNTHQLPVGFIAQVVEEHCTGIVEVMGSNPVLACIAGASLCACTGIVD